MTTSAPGWLPDPSGRHEYRYWDGTSWTGDVATNGVTSVDPPAVQLPPPGAAPASADPAGNAGGPPTAPYDLTATRDAPAAPYDAPTAAHDPTAAPYDAPTAAHDPTAAVQGPPTASYQAPPGYGPPGSPSGPYPPAPGPPMPPPRSGPSKGLLIGLVVLAVALVAGVGWALTRDDGDDTATEDAETTAGTDGADSETPGDGTADGGDLGIDLGDDSALGGSDDLGDISSETFETLLEDPFFRDVFVQGVVQGMEADGIPTEQAQCFADGLLDAVSVDQLFEIGTSGGDMSSVGADDYADLVQLMSDCGIDPNTVG